MDGDLHVDAARAVAEEGEAVMTDNVKHQDQRIREVEAEIVVLQLCCRDVMHAIKEARRVAGAPRVFSRNVWPRSPEWRRLNRPAPISSSLTRGSDR
jgi:hypothetical protein